MKRTGERMEKGKNIIKRKKSEFVKGIGTILLIDLVLALIFLFVPSPSVEGLKLNKYKPTIVTFYTAHFVHGGVAHLLGNIAVFTITSILLFTILFTTRKEKIFYKLCLISLTLLPFLLSTTWIIAVSQIKSGYYSGKESTMGFSGIASSFIGFLICAYLFEYLDFMGIRVHPFLAFLSLLLLVALLFVVPYHNTLLLFFVLLVSFSIPFCLFVRSIEIGSKKLNKFLVIFQVTLPFLLVVLFSFLLFPFNYEGVDILGHYTGVIIGFTIYWIKKIFNGSLNENKK